jgi:glycosyltransferase involved in cell wall biosynthesis
MAEPAGGAVTAMPGPGDDAPAPLAPPAARRPLRILVLAPQPFFQDRGTPIATRALLEALAARGHALELLTFHEGEDVAIAGLTIHRIPAIPGVRGIRPGFSLQKLMCDALLAMKCFALLASGRFQLVHALEESAFIALVARRIFGVPYVYDMDSSLAQQMEEKYPSLRPVRAALEAFEGVAVRQSLAVVAVCPALRDVAHGHAPGASVRVIEDFSLIDGAAPAAESLAATIGRDGPIVLYVGNLEAYQGIDLLLEAFAHARARAPRAEVVVIGGHEADIARYRERCRALGIAENVHFLGPRPLAALGGLLRQAEIVVSPRTQGRNTPMKVYSYLDSGRPLLATRLPTHTQVLDDEIAMLAAPEPAAFGSALAALLGDADLRRRLADAARARVAAEWSRPAFRRKVDAFYGGVEERLLPEPWPLRLFRRSVMKQEKWRRIAALLPPGLENMRCLDVGADNGVISLLLRRAGGTWTSVDLDETTVEAIRTLVGERVERIDGGRTRFADGAFDQIVIVDFLEHIEDDRAFAAELARLLAPGGTLIVNVPHLRPGSLMNRLRHAVGLTDELHGHVRHGYTLSGLRDVLGPAFAFERATTYSRAFSESVDIALNAAYAAKRRGGAAPTRKGTVVTGRDLETLRKEFRLLSLAYPLLWVWTRLDVLLAWRPGHLLVTRFRRVA